MKKILVFLTAMVFVMSFVSAAIDTTTSFGTKIGGIGEIAESSVERATDSPSPTHSAKLYAPFDNGVGPEGRVRIEFDEEMMLSDLDSISWMQYVTGGYIGHVDVLLDTAGDGGGADDALVFEWDKVTNIGPTPLVPDMTYARNSWVNTFDDRGIVNDAAYGWLNSGPPGPVGDGGFMTDTLVGWKTTYPNAKVIALEIEVDGWVAESQAYIDDIMINGMLVENFEAGQQVIGDLAPFFWAITVSPDPLNFGSIPRGLDIVDPADNGPVMVDATGSETADDFVYVYTDVTGTDEVFYESLLELEISSVWTDIIDLALELAIPEEGSESYAARLHGDTVTPGYSAGAKSATVVYTAYGEPL